VDDTEKQIMRLDFRIESLEKTSAKVEAELKEFYGMLKEVVGKLHVTLQFDEFSRQLSEMRRENNMQSSEIGELRGSLRAVAEAMKQSTDKSLASAAQGITINIDQDNAHGGQGVAGINTGTLSREEKK
jgi:uncharacterized coiled-coil protein SlyX